MSDFSPNASLHEENKSSRSTLKDLANNLDEHKHVPELLLSKFQDTMNAPKEVLMKSLQPATNQSYNSNDIIETPLHIAHHSQLVSDQNSSLLQDPTNVYIDEVSADHDIQHNLSYLDKLDTKCMNPTTTTLNDENSLLRNFDPFNPNQTTTPTINPKLVTPKLDLPDNDGKRSSLSALFHGWNSVIGGYGTEINQNSSFSPMFTHFQSSKRKLTGAVASLLSPFGICSEVTPVFEKSSNPIKLVLEHVDESEKPIDSLHHLQQPSNFDDSLSALFQRITVSDQEPNLVNEFDNINDEEEAFFSPSKTKLNSAKFIPFENLEDNYNPGVDQVEVSSQPLEINTQSFTSSHYSDAMETLNNSSPSNWNESPNKRMVYQINSEDITEQTPTNHEISNDSLFLQSTDRPLKMISNECVFQPVLTTSSSIISLHLNSSSLVSNSNTLDGQLSVTQTWSHSPPIQIINQPENCQMNTFLTLPINDNLNPTLTDKYSNSDFKISSASVSQEKDQTTENHTSNIYEDNISKLSSFVDSNIDLSKHFENNVSQKIQSEVSHLELSDLNKNKGDNTSAYGNVDESNQSFPDISIENTCPILHTSRSSNSGTGLISFGNHKENTSFEIKLFEKSSDGEKEFSYLNQNDDLNKFLSIQSNNINCKSKFIGSNKNIVSELETVTSSSIIEDQNSPVYYKDNVNPSIVESNESRCHISIPIIADCDSNQSINNHLLQDDNHDDTDVQFMEQGISSTNQDITFKNLSDPVLNKTEQNRKSTDINACVEIIDKNFISSVKNDDSDKYFNHTISRVVSEVEKPVRLPRQSRRSTITLESPRLLKKVSTPANDTIECEDAHSSDVQEQHFVIHMPSFNNQNLYSSIVPDDKENVAPKVSCESFSTVPDTLDITKSRKHTKSLTKSNTSPLSSVNQCIDDENLNDVSEIIDEKLQVICPLSLKSNISCENNDAEKTRLKKDICELKSLVNILETLHSKYFLTHEEALNQYSQALLAIGCAVAQADAELVGTKTDSTVVHKALVDSHRRWQKNFENIQEKSKNEKTMIKKTQNLHSKYINLSTKLEKHYNYYLTKLEKCFDTANETKDLCERELNRLRVQSKQLELKTESLKTQIKLKTKENEELTQICDSLLV